MIATHAFTTTIGLFRESSRGNLHAAPSFFNYVPRKPSKLRAHMYRT